MKVGDLVRINWAYIPAAAESMNGTVGTLIGYYWCDDNDEVLVRVLFPCGIRLASWENLELVQRATKEE